jgi:hypothetical protein
MATTITAGNATNNGAAIGSDSAGTLEIKTGSGAGTTAISIDASQAVTLPGNLIVTGTATIGGQPAGGNYAMNAYVAPATWTKPAGLKAVKVTVVGAGGNGGPIAAANANYIAGGGGGGGAAIDYIPAPSIPGPVAVTAGSGTNSFGAFCSATAGSSAPTSSADPVPGGVGGTGTGGTFNTTGQAGDGGGPNTQRTGGTGGSSILGGGGAGGVVPSSGVAAGAAGGNYGGGGGGGAKGAPSAATTSGGAGAPGIVIVEEFY